MATKPNRGSGATAGLESIGALVQQAVSAQERALDVVTSAVGAHEHSIERVETLIAGMLDVLTGQLHALRTQAQLGQNMLSDPASSQSGVFLKITQDWMDAYSRLLGAAPAAVGRTSNS